MLAIVFALAAATPLELADVVTGPGCPLHLVGDTRHHPFAEAQIACDAYVAFALIDELRVLEDEEARAPRVRALHALLADALGRGQSSFRKMPNVALEGTRISTSVLARGYLVAMMGGMKRVHALPADHEALYDAIASSLVVDLTRAEANGTWLPSYAGGYWPCDHALAASGLALHASEESQVAGRALSRRLRALLDAGFVTQVNAKGQALEPLARGTVLAWTAAFLALGGHDDDAKAFASALARDFCEPLPLVADARACREWPRGIDRKADAVSGPLFMGYGSGASALAIAAFRATGDDDSARSVEALMPLAPALARVPDVRADPKSYPLENAILAWGVHASAWR
jgi:hypothetical protein